MIKKMLAIGSFILSFAMLYAQDLNPEIVATAGDSNQGNNIQLDWTLGELAVTTIQSSNQQITQGFHQPQIQITSVLDFSEDIGSIDVFPNPSIDHLNMKMSFFKKEKIQIRLYNLEGKQILSKYIEDRNVEEILVIKSLPAGNYFLSFYIDEHKTVQTFKIQKIN